MEPNSNLRFLAFTTEPVRHLPDFQKHHRVPTDHSEGNRRFVQGLVQPLIDSDLQANFGSLRKAYGLKRKEIAVDGPFEGEGSVKLPFFQYRITADLAEDDPSRVLFCRSIENITEPARVAAPPFLEAFPYPFSVLELTTREPLDLEAIVDSIEDAENDQLELDYDKDLTWCELSILDTATTIRISEHAIETTTARDSSPPELLEAFASVQHFISQLNLMPFAFERS